MICVLDETMDLPGHPCPAGFLVATKQHDVLTAQRCPEPHLWLTKVILGWPSCQPCQHLLRLKVTHFGDDSVIAKCVMVFRTRVK